MKIVRMNPYDKGKIRAFFDLEVNGFVIKGFKIMEGINGLFVSFPSQKVNEEWNDTVYCYKETRDKLNKIAKEHYNKLDGVNQEQPEQQSQEPKTSDLSLIHI